MNNNVDAEFVVSGMLTLMPKVSKHNSITISDKINDIIIFANVFSITNHSRVCEFLKSMYSIRLGDRILRSLGCTPYQYIAATVAQLVRVFFPQAEVWVFKSRFRQNKVVKTDPLPC